MLSRKIFTTLLCLASTALPVVSGFSRPGTPVVSGFSRTSLQTTEPPHTLRPGPPVARPIAPGGTHAYLLDLAAGQAARIIVEQHGIDLLVTVFNPPDHRAFEMDTANGTDGPEAMSVVADAAGPFRIEVHPARGERVAGRYEIRVEDVRVATAEDRRRYSVQALMSEATDLSDADTAESNATAIAKYEEALGVWRDLKDAAGEQTTLTYLAILNLSLRENQRAVAYYTQLRARFHASGDRRQEGLVLMAIGWIDDSYGDYQNALDHMTLALDLLRQAGRGAPEASALSSLGLLYGRLGEYQKALDFYRQGLATYRAIGGRSGEAVALQGLGQIYTSLGEYQKALDHYSQALPIFRSTGNRWREAQTLSGIGWARALMGDRQQALTDSTDALTRGRAGGDRAVEAQTLHALASVYDVLGDKGRALEYYSEALPLRRSLGDRAGEASTLAGLARVERDRGQFDDARAHIEAALDGIESLRTTVARQELRSSYLASKQDEYEFYTSLLMQLHRGDPAKGYDAAALEASERARARGLLDLLAEARADIRSGVDAALVDRERLLQHELNATERARLKLLSTRHSEADAAAIQQQLDARLAAYQEVQAQIRAASPRYAALTQPRHLDAAAIRGLLDDRTTILEYALGGERSFLWAITRTSLRSYELPGRAEIETAARRLFELLGRSDRIAQSQAALAAAELSRIVLGPVARRLGTNRLLIVSDGVLQYVPFGVLPDPAASLRQAVEATGAARSEWPQPLIVGHEVTYLPSASTLAVLRDERRDRRTAPKTVAVLSDPVFQAADPRVARSGAPAAAAVGPTASGGAEDVVRSARDSGLFAFDRLPFSRREAEAIVALAPPGQAFKAVDFAASRGTATGPALIDYRILHFATHALMNSAHPELSGIVLSLVNERGEPQDGFLRAHEIYNLRLSADLVVLSGCQTALGPAIRGEGLVGLTRGFMYAGATRVVASLWNVKDAATSELMQRFYQGMLGKKLSPAAALRAAQISMWREPRWSASYNWAAFVLQGE